MARHSSRSLLVAGLLATAVALVCNVAVVSAHARYKSSTPGKGEVVTTSPPSVTITFTQDVQKISGTYGIDVTDASGASATAGTATLDDTDRSKMSVPLKASLTNGRYEVRWKNVSDEDGDPVEGAFSFYVGTQPTATDLAADQALEAVGFEDETPASGTSPSAVTGTAVSATPRSTATATNNDNDSDGGNNSVIWIVVGGVAAGAILGFGGWWLWSRRK